MEPDVVDTRRGVVVNWHRLLKSRLSYLIRSHTSVSVFILSQQAVATVWFWVANIHDQVHATGHGENTATWLGGGFVFLAITAYLQFKAMRVHPSRLNIILFAVQVLSAAGDLIAFSVFVHRRWWWAPADTYCVAVIAVMLLSCLALHRYCKGKTCERSEKVSFWLGINNKYMQAGWAIVLLAIAFRSLPRVFQGLTLFINNPMTIMTVVSGTYIALIRLLAVGDAHRRAPSNASRRAVRVELIGNVGSQLVLAVGWTLAKLFS